MIRKYHNHTPQTKPRHREEESREIYSNKTPVRQKRKATRSLLLFKMFAKLERTQSNAQQNRLTQNHHNQWEAHQTTDQQQQNYRLRTNSSLSHLGA